MMKVRRLRSRVTFAPWLRPRRTSMRWSAPAKPRSSLAMPRLPPAFSRGPTSRTRRSPLPQAGMGAVSVANGDPQAALPYFKRAQKLGASVASFAVDRGLAYDLLGQQAQAQADYRLRSTGRDLDEARRRLALSLAIGGDQAGALQISRRCRPRAIRRPARPRLRACTDRRLQLGDPGHQRRDARFIRRCRTAPAASSGALCRAQKAAAVNLGVFPDS